MKKLFAVLVMLFVVVPSISHAMMHSRWVNTDNLVYYDTYYWRWIDAIGPDVRKVILDFNGPTPVGADNADPLGWTVTAIAGDAGDGTITAANEAGGAITITTDDTENDGINITFNNEAFTLASGDPTYFGIRLKLSDADQTDLAVGLNITETGFWNGGTSDGITYESADATAICTFTTEKDSTETSDTAAGTLTDATYSTLEFYYDGTTVYAYFDASLVATSTTNIPDNEPLTFMIELLTGEGNTNTVTIDWIRIIQVQ